ncbi:MAG: hypothetical protein ABJO30_14895 [Hyphomicrobiales bacterium]
MMIARIGVIGVVVAALLAAVVWFTVDIDRRVIIPTTIASLEPPQGYEPSLRFPGVEDTNTDGSFTLNSFPVQAIGSLGEMFASVDRATPTLNNRGITVEETIPITWQGKQVLLFRGKQNNDEGVPHEKWIAVFVAERPYMMAFQEPVPGKLRQEDVIKTFSSLRLDGVAINRTQ